MVVLSTKIIWISEDIAQRPHSCSCIAPSLHCVITFSTGCPKFGSGTKLQTEIYIIGRPVFLPFWPTWAFFIIVVHWYMWTTLDLLCQFRPHFWPFGPHSENKKVRPACCGRPVFVIQIFFTNYKYHLSSRHCSHLQSKKKYFCRYSRLFAESSSLM